MYREGWLLSNIKYSIRSTLSSSFEVKMIAKRLDRTFFNKLWAVEVKK